MKRVIFFSLTLSALLCGAAYGQGRTDEEAIRAVADNILRQPVTRFVGVTTGAVYNSTAEIPAGEDAKFQSPLTEWHYSNGVLDMSLLRLGEYLGDARYTDYARNHVAFGFANYAYFKERYPGGRRHWDWPFGQLWNFKELDDCGAMGAAVVNVNRIDPRPEYKNYIDSAAYHILHRQDRLADGTLCRTFPRQMTVWADDVYMSVSFLSQMARTTGEPKYLDEAVRQIIQITDLLWCPEKELFYHCYYSDLERNGVAFWGRANGWITVAICLTLEAMPVDHPRRAELIALLDRQMLGATRHQNANGMWNQLLDKPDSYDESSVTAMYVYGMVKGINNGWLDAAVYTSPATAGWRALKETQITPEGQFRNVCVGTGIKDDLPFYYARPVGENEKHGLGLIIDTGIEMMKLKGRK